MNKTILLFMTIAILLSSAVFAGSRYVIFSDKQIDVNDPAFLVSFGIKLFNLGQKDAGLAMFQAAAGPSALAYKAYNNIGVYYYGKQEFPAAIEAFSKALELNSESETALSNLALIYHEMGDYSKAIGILQKLVELYPENPNYNYDLAINIVDNFRENTEGSLEDAIYYFERADELMPEIEFADQNIEVLQSIIASGQG